LKAREQGIKKRGNIKLPKERNILMVTFLDNV